MKERFINNQIIGLIYKKLVSKLNLDLNNNTKTILIKKINYVMNQVYKNIDLQRVNSNNLKDILRQYINNTYSIIYNDINNDKSNNENFEQDNKFDRDRQMSGKNKNVLDLRSSNADDKFASFNDSFNIQPRQQNNFQGRFDPQDQFAGKKSDFTENIDDRYKQLQDDRNFNTNNRRPSTPPELKGDGGANLNKYARQNKNTDDRTNTKQSFNKSSNEKPISANDFLKQSDPRAKGTQGNNISKDNFNFGSANDLENNYDTLDGSGGIQFEGNMDMNQWNTGINPSKFNIDENIPLAQKLKQFEAERSALDSKSTQDNNKNPQNKNLQNKDTQNKKQVSFNNDDDDYERINELENQRKRLEIEKNQQRNSNQRPPNQNNQNNNVNSKIVEYEETIGLLLEKLKDVQNQQIKYMNNGSENTDVKLSLLENKKEEILGELSRLQNMTLQLEKHQQIIQERENIIKQKENELEQKMKKLGKIQNMNEKSFVIKASSGKFNYSLDNNYKNIIGIELTNYNITYDDKNINNNNNKLYFSIIDNNENTDNFTISTEYEDCIDEIYINSNKLKVITVPEDTYDILGLIEILNKITNHIGIYFSIIKGKIMIKSEKNNRIKLYLDKEYENNLLPLLGFIKIIGDKNRYIADKKYNIQTEKLIQIFIKNISSEPFAEFLIGEKIHKFSKEVQFENLNKFEIEVKLDGKIYIPENPYLLEFNIIMNNNILSNDSIRQTKKNESSESNLDTDDGDLLTNISKKMNL